MRMRILIAEDDFASRCVLQGMLAEFGRCDVAVDGDEAVRAFRSAQLEGQPYALVCLDIMMPRMSGQQALEQIRAYEADNGIHGLDGVKILMTTARDDFDSIMSAFRGQCEGYLVKPIAKAQLVKQLRTLGLAP